MGRQQALIVGLGQFGMALARALVGKDEEVLAVDVREDRVQIAATFATEALTMDAMDEAELARLHPEARDLCVCAIGDESRGASIIVTAMLRQMGAKRLVARASDEIHERILHLVGAHEVLNPERILGERLVDRLSVRGVLDEVPLGDDLRITELAAPPALRGRSLVELRLPHTAQLTVLAIRRTRGEEARVLLPSASMRIEAGDVLVVVGPVGAARRFVGG